MHYEVGKDYAQRQDQNDSLKNFRDQFHIPQHNGKDSIYFCGNSLGLQPKNAQEWLSKEMHNWKTKGVEGHFTGEQPWVDYHHRFKKGLSHICGSLEHEVVPMNNLTTNLHLLLASFYQPEEERVKIMIEAGAFPSDYYAAASHMRRMGIDPDEHLLTLVPDQGEVFSTEYIIEKILKLDDSLALVLFPGIQYYSGQLFDMEAISKAAHAVGAYAGFDLAHAVGNVPLRLHDWEADFATWCSYKYLNSGPGGISGIFVHERHSSEPQFPKLTGWWGHERSTRFDMDNEFKPAPGADAWMLSNMNILSAAIHLGSLEMFIAAGMPALREKSKKLTGYLEYLILNDDILSEQIDILTPADPKERGCQLSFFLAQNGRKIFDGLMKNGVILDWREPNVIRVAPTPMYNSFTDVWNFYEIIRGLITL